MLKMTIDNEEVVSKNDFTIKEEMLSASSTILNNTYPKSWEDDKDYTSRFYYPKDYAKLNIQNFGIEPEEAGTTVEINGSATLTDVDTTKESRVLKLLGQTSQTTISGKNLFDIATNTSDNYAVNNNISSISGNTMVLNGAGGASSRVIRLQNQVANKTYTASFNTDITTNRILVRIRKSDDSGWITNSDITWSGWTYNTTYSAWYYSANASNNKATFTFTVPSGLYWQLGIVNVNSTNATFSNIQLEEGSSATTYEPYVGGVPSPNPQYPQPVNVVSGDNEIDICGKNLFDYENAVLTSFYGTIGTKEQNGVKGGWGMWLTLPKPLPSGTYTLSIKVKDADNSTGAVIGLYDSNNAIVGTNLNAHVSGSKTYTATNGITKIRIDNGKQASTTVIYDIQIETGNQATTYEPYVGSSYPIYLGVENLFDKDNFTLTNGFINADQKVFSTSATSYTFTISCKPNTTYTIHKIASSRFRVGTSTTTLSNNSTFTNAIANDSGTTITITSGASDKYLSCLYYNSSYDTTITQQQILDSLSVNEGSKYNHISTTPIELCKIGTYQDKIYKGEGYNLFDEDNIVSNSSTSKYYDFTTPLVAGTYTFSCVNTASKRIRIYKGATYDENNYTDVISWNANTSATFTTTDYINRILINSGSAITITEWQIMFNKGGSLPYEPYNAKDKWLLHKEIGKVVLDGSESWTVNAGGTNTIAFGLTPSINAIATGSDNINAYVSHFKGNVNGFSADEECFWLNGSGYFRARINKTTASNVSNFQTWLSTHNTIVYYVLATPTTTEITDALLLSQLNDLESE